MKQIAFILVMLPLFATCQEKESVYDEPLTTGFDTPKEQPIEPQEYDKKCKKCPAVPVDQYKILLGITGAAFGIYKLSKNKEK
jgi:hypothetical protein